MKCIVAKTAGFCGGVRKAFLMVKERFDGKVNGERVFILGSLVHNENVMKMVTEMKIKKIDNLDPVGKNDTVIITAHGVGKDVLEEIERRGAKAFDVTCPKVSMVQNCAREYFEKGFEIVIFGDKEHKEIRGINGWCEKKAIVIADFVELEGLLTEIRKGRIEKPILLISQTTQNIENFERVKKVLLEVVTENGGEIEVVDTICRATFVRQKEALKLAQEMDMVIVIGGKSSSNTKQLWKIVAKENPKTLWIEDPLELKKKESEKLLKNAKSVGIVSGASTSTFDIEKARRIVENCD